MTRARLVQRLKWYYPTEKFHTYVSFPTLLIYIIAANKLSDVIFLSYGLIVCIVILYQGQWYWKLKLDSLEGKSFDQDKNLQFFTTSKRLNWILILIMIPVLAIQIILNINQESTHRMLLWGMLANLFAILEHINYYYIQLMIDNAYDLRYVIRNKRLKKSSLAKDLKEGQI